MRPGGDSETFTITCEHHRKIFADDRFCPGPPDPGHRRSARVADLLDAGSHVGLYSDAMKIPIWFLTLAVGAIFALQGWTLNQVVNLRSDVAAIKAVLPIKPETTQNHELRSIELARQNRS